MKQTPLFSVAVVHYNQPRYLYTALDSVLAQDYARIELILADDGSTDFDEEKIRAYVQANAGANIERVLLLHNEKNKGTVQNLNGVIAAASGEYINFFAADDALYDEGVLTRFAEKMQTLPEGALCVSAQCVMMDQNLEAKLGDFTDVNLASLLNEQGAAAQFEVLMSSAFYGLGSSAFRLADFATYGRFDERYKLVEDWSYFLAQTRSGRAVRFSDFYALRHREGGVSHNLCPVEPSYVRVFKDDILKINEKEILPYLSRLPLQKQVKVLAEYEAVSAAYSAQYGPRETVSRMVQFGWNPSLYLRKMVWYLLSKYAKILKGSLGISTIIFALWILCGSLGMSFAQLAVGYLNMPYLAPLMILLIRYVFPTILCLSGLTALGMAVLGLAFGIKKLLRKS